MLPITVNFSLGAPVPTPILSTLASRYNNLLFEPPAPLKTSLLTSASFCHAHIKFTPPAAIVILSPVGKLI